jgi:hypothetical protein
MSHQRLNTHRLTLQAFFDYPMLLPQIDERYHLQQQPFQESTLSDESVSVQANHHARRVEVAHSKPHHDQYEDQKSQVSLHQASKVHVSDIRHQC